MSGASNSILFATICNTVGEASAYSLWFTQGGRQFVVDLSDHLRDASGLTGVAYHNGRIYLAVQARASRILVLDMALNVVDTITHDGFNDLHALRVVGNKLMIVSARGGCLLERDLATGDTVARVRFDPRSWVCDVLCTKDDIWLCCHKLSWFDPAAKDGGVFSVRHRRTVVDGLMRPHSLIPYGDGYAVLDSVNARAMFFKPDGDRQTVPLQGFLRGAVASGDGSLFVAGGPERTISRKTPDGDGARGLREVLRERLRIFVVKQGALAQVILPECPGFEIYDLIGLPAGSLSQQAADRIVPVEQGLFARYYYTSLVTAHARAAASALEPAPLPDSGPIPTIRA